MMVYGIEGDGDGIKAVYLGEPQKGQFFSPQGVPKMELKHPVYNRHSGLANKKIVTIRPVGKYDCVGISQQQRSRTRRSCCFASQVHNGGVPNDADAVVNLEFECQMYNLTRLPPERQKIMAKVGLLKDVADWSNTGEVV